jgi:hypothetical protein
MRTKSTNIFRRDLFDHGARTWKSQRKAIDIAWVTLPAAAGAITTFSNAMERLGLGLPGSLLLPGYMLAAAVACIWLIQAKSPAKQPRRYRFPQELRVSAKIGLPAFIAMFVVSASDLRPNIMRFEHAIAGVICTADQKPIAHVFVMALDKFGRPSSKALEATDDDGYFFLDLDVLGLPPREIRVSGSRCAPVKLSVTSAVFGVRGCSSESMLAQSQEKMWVYSCAD